MCASFFFIIENLDFASLFKRRSLMFSPMRRQCWWRGGPLPSPYTSAQEPRAPVSSLALRGRCAFFRGGEPKRSLSATEVSSSSVRLLLPCAGERRLKSSRAAANTSAFEQKPDSSRVDLVTLEGESVIHKGKRTRKTRLLRVVSSPLPKPGEPLLDALEERGILLPRVFSLEAESALSWRLSPRL